jgi:DNA-damage-inducible protein J
MSKTEMINTRLEPRLKKASEAVFARLGVSTSEAITMFLNQVVLHKGFPFPLRIPNAETRKAIKETKERRNVEVYDDYASFLKTMK